MPEQPIWTGSPSQLKNFKTFVVCGIVTVLLIAAGIALGTKVKDTPPWLSTGVAASALVPVFIAVWRWFQLKSHKFELTSERLLTTTGVINVVTDSLELYRVKDIRMSQPLLLRFFGLENIEMTTSDASSPLVCVEFIPKQIKLADKIRAQVEACRVQKGTREVELE
jgi:membrane protein YdbS with pleckstrin-like domain